MARTIIGLNDPKAVKRWAGMLAVDASHKSYFGPRFMGRGAAAEVPVQILTDLETDAGETVFYDLLAELQSTPTEGEDNLEGNEEAQRYFTDQVYIDQQRHGVNTGGAMTRKRTLHNLRERAKAQMGAYWAQIQDESLFCYAAGARGINPNFKYPTTWTGRSNNAFTAADTNHIFYGGTSTAFNNITITDKMSLTMVDKCKTRADVQGGGASGTSVLQPCKLDGEEKYVMVMHTWQADDIRQNTTTGQWLDITKALTTAVGKASPLYKGSLGEYRGVILHEHRNVIRFNTAGAGANVEAARAMFLGAQALVCAYGSPGGGTRFNWNEESRDNGDKLVISSGLIWGCKKTTFTIGGVAQDFGLFTVDTAAASR